MGMDGRPFEISDDAEGLHRLMDLCESKWDVVASILGVAGLIGTTIMCSIYFFFHSKSYTRQRNSSLPGPTGPASPSDSPAASEPISLSFETRAT